MVERIDAKGAQVETVVGRLLQALEGGVGGRRPLAVGDPHRRVAAIGVKSVHRPAQSPHLQRLRRRAFAGERGANRLVHRRLDRADRLLRHRLLRAGAAACGRGRRRGAGAAGRVGKGLARQGFRGLRGGRRDVPGRPVRGRANGDLARRGRRRSSRSGNFAENRAGRDERGDGDRRPEPCGGRARQKHSETFQGGAIRIPIRSGRAARLVLIKSNQLLISMTLSPQGAEIAIF